MLLEWFETKTGVVLIFNDEHGCISVFDADTGNLKHQSENNDMFLSGYQIIEDFLYTVGWFWNPFPMRILFHIPTFLETINYEPIVLSTDDCEHLHDIPIISLFGCKTIAEYLSNEDIIMKQEYLKLQLKNFNKNKNQKTLLHLFLLNESVTFLNHSKELLTNILKLDISKFEISSTGKHHTESLYREIDERETDFKTIVIKTICHSFLEGLIESEIDSQFFIQTDIGNLNIIMKHKFDIDIDFNKRMESYGYTKEQILFEFGSIRYRFNPENPLSIIICSN